MDKDASPNPDRRELVASLVDTGKRAFDPSSDVALRKSGEKDFNELLDRFVG